MAVDSRTPSGTAPCVSLHVSGIETAKVCEADGVDVVTEYGHMIACEGVKASAY